MRASMTLVRAVVFAAAMQATAALAGPAYFTDDAGVAINGYDPVAYFTDGQPTMGKADLEAQWNGVTWRFASAEHRDAFLADPGKYAPQYGGYCAYAAAKNAVAETDPVDGWTVHDGRLYLNFDSGIRDTWRQDIPGYLEASEANWPALRQGIEAQTIPVTRK